PLITFNNPTNIVIDVNQPKYTINACIESDEALKSYNIFVNGYASRGFIPAKTADCDFRIEKTIELLEGNNTIKIIAENSGGSTVSNTYTINYKKASTDITAPEIIITSPNVTRAAIVTEVKKELVIQGIVKDESGIFDVFVNGKEAFVDAQGNFSAKVFLAIGENKFTVTATDAKQNTTTKEFTIDRKSNLNEEIVNNNTPALKTGKYYALIIGVQDYRDENISDLDNPVGDAQSLSQALSKNYTFESQNIKFLSNPTRKEITQALEFYYDNITKEDNLLIFYAGHGYWDEKFEQGYWLASDAERGNRGTWLSNGTIRDYMRAIPAKHSLLITDACFGGGIFKSRNAFANASTAVNQLNKLPSRKAMTSGALSEVPDKSVFIEYLVKRLDENAEKYLSSEQLFASFKIAVINNSANGQVPQYGEVKATGDEGGDFIFIKR
ncbi:MAG: caspase family protein, partial [Bacteroidales bacterium]|nr:caspase family protein [Bacteroidales bacterium]